MKKYEAYKKTGIEWIGQIPKGWSVVPLKYYLSLKGRIGWNGLKSEEFQEKSYAYLVTGQDFNSDVVNWEKCYQINKERYDEDPFIQLENGDLLVTKDGTIGKVAKVVNLDKPACLNSGIFVVKQTKGVFEQNYLYWVLVSNQLKEFVGFNSTGSTIAHLYQNVFENMPLTVPPLTEQKAIASYLDYKVGQIDASISAINTQIDDLKSYRQSIISEAVTKGLDKNVEMKDSGIDKFPMIRFNWNTSKLKYIASIRSGSALPTNNIKEDALYEVYGGNGCMGKADEYNTESPAIIIGRVGALCGNVHLIKTKKWVTDNALILNIKRDVTYEYLYYYLTAYDLNTLNSSNAQPLITGTKVLDVVTPMPSLNEQIMIANYLDDKTSMIDETIDQISVQIVELKSYKSSLITEAVTGKIDLRDWKPKEEKV